MADSEKNILARVKDIDAIDRDEIEEMLDDGMLPLRVYKEKPEIPLHLIQSIARMKKLHPSSTVQPPAQLAPVTSSDPLMRELTEQLRSETQREMLQNQLDDMRAERSYRQEKRRLEIQQIRQDQRMQRLEMRGEYGDEEDDDDEDPPAPKELTGDPLADLDFENKPIESLMMGLQILKQKNENGDRKVKQPTVKIDATKPVSVKRIKEEFSRLNPQQMQRMKEATDKQLTQGLKEEYPGITAENLKKAIHTVRHYAG